MPARKLRSVKRPKQYQALRAKGYGKKSAARITNDSWSRSHPKKRGRK